VRRLWLRLPRRRGPHPGEYLKNLPFALDVAKSAPNPVEPVSHLGNTTSPLYLDLSALDPEKTNNPLSDFRFSVSYGDPQPVQVLARRSLGPVTLKYQINGGAEQSAATAEWNGGERFGDVGDVHYRIMRGNVTGTSPGDEVKVWFEASGGAVESDSFTYTARVESSNRVLVLAAEDYTGISPVYKKTSGPTYLSYYLDALAANGISADVYDVDANDRKAPSQLGVLSHYDAVIWYTGDDVLTREPGMAAGTASRLAHDEILAVRAYLNEGGRLFRTGKYAGFGEAFGYEFNLETNAPCNPDDNGEDGCEPLQDDFLQYYLGAYLYNDEAGTTANGKLYDVFGFDTPFDSLAWSFGGPSANNQDHSASFIATSGILPAEEYPQFTSWASAKYDRPGGPFDPHTGSYYAYSNIADISYKRLTKTIGMPAGGGNLSFWVSHDTEEAWDHVFVEAHTVGQDDWTTLPDLNGHTSTSTGDSCPEGWRELHPFLDHYQTLNADNTCSPTGTTGSWNADSGSSGGRPAAANTIFARVGAVVGRPVGLRRQAGRGLDRLRQRLVGAGTRGVRGRHCRLDRRGHNLVRDRHGWLDGHRPRRPVARRTRTTAFAPPRAGSPRARRSQPKTRSTSGSGWRESQHPAPGTRSWGE
jgi:hypothetical protein